MLDNAGDDMAVAHRAPPGPPMSESSARSALAARFRAAGFRILYDVSVSVPGAELTVDGYDPAKKVGFEYVAREEINTDLTSSERGALAGHSQHRLLIVDAMAAEKLDSLAIAFLQKLKALDAKRLKPSSASGPQ